MKTILKCACWILVLTTACNKEEAKKAICEAISAMLVNGSPTNFSFSNNGNLGTDIANIVVNAGTDSSYAWSFGYPNAGLPPNSMTKTNHDNSMIFYTVVLDGGKVGRFAGADPSSHPTDEYRFVYTADRITEEQGWLANAAGTMFQVTDIKFFYDANGNMIHSEEYVDFVALFSLAFGSDPTGYAPIQIGLEEYEVGDSPNPLYGTFWVDQMYWSVMKNLPKSITYKDANGATIKTETLTLTKDGNNYPTHAAISATKYMDASYVCQ